jgi:hypothetical protein
MTPANFVSKWQGVELSERAASQSRFNDLCSTLDVKNPIDSDPTGQDYTFEKPSHPQMITKILRAQCGEYFWFSLWIRRLFREIATY